ncbi:MAG: helix-turn-helix transcriptional regulator [Clostridia bacterium]|nr:helix-turn-helix transcriptional regulator [Clostridia bacterium]
MYHLSKFCNIIFELRKERGWTQGVLAEKLNITPQSISKWECGIGYPDVTLFPLIAELFGVDIGVLFGQVKEANGNMNSKNEKKYVFEPLHHVELLIGNECDIMVTRREAEKAHLDIIGDNTFMEYLGIENADGVLKVSVKNPTGSDTKWIPYDRGNYSKRNMITLYTGKEECDLYAINYLDLNVYESELDDNTNMWIYTKESLPMSIEI